MKVSFKIGLARARTRISLAHRLMTVLVILMAWPLVATGQDRQMQLAIDYAQFRLQQDFVYLEIYYSIPRKNLTFHQGQTGLQAQALIKTYIQSGNRTMQVDSLFIQDEIQTRSEITPTQKFIEMSAIQIKPDNYLLRVTVTDLNAQRTVDWSDSLKIRPFPSDSLAFSHIELATSIQPQPSAGDRYVKNGLRVTPNPSAIYGTGLPQLYFYAEAYNLMIAHQAAGSTYHLEYTILDARDSLVQRIIGTPKAKPGTSTVVHGSLNINDLTSGIYRLQLKIIDDYNQHCALAEKTFLVYRAEDLLKTQLVKADAEVVTGENEFMLMDEAALNDYFQMLRYIASEEEKSLFKKLDINGKRNLLVNFWQQRDPDAHTAVNEAKKIYLELLDLANREYTIRNKPGWKSDRGRVLLSYGKPDFVERVPATSDARAYQVWYYYQLEGGVEFIFVERRADSDYQLVHSTKRNEIHDYEWKTHYVLQ